MPQTLGEMEAFGRLRRDSVLMKIDALLDWQRLRSLLSGLYKREQQDRGGERPYEVLSMFKAVLLGQWHDLSDPKLQEALEVRLDFIRFCGFRLDELPDDTTLCRFRNRLIQAQRYEPLLSEVNRQLQEHGLMLKQAKAALVDATLITSAARARQEIVVAVNESGEAVEYGDGSQPGVVLAERQSADADATWLKKGKRNYFGYRSHVVTDEEGFAKGIHTTPANESEVRHLSAALQAAQISAANTQRVLADKGYASAQQRQWLRQQGLKSGLMHKASRNHPLSQRQKRANRLISQVRWRVEQFFGTLKRRFAMARSRYFTTAKVQAQMVMKSLCANLLKAANKISLLSTGSLSGTHRLSGALAVG